MNKALLIASISLLLFCMSCDEDCECPSGPFYANLKLKITINNETPEVEVIVFRGRIESQDTVLIDTVNQTDIQYELEAGTYYSATARYKSGNKEILAINGKEMTLGEDDCGCDKPQNHSLNLKLAN